MPSKQYTFKGKCKWAKLFKPDEKYNNFQITLYPDKASLKAYVKAGCQGEIKEDEDGQRVVFRRKPSILTKKGKLWELGAPKVVDTSGEDFTAFLGNGSEVEVTVETYDTDRGLGTRLEKVTVLKHVEYKPDEAA